MKKSSSMHGFHLIEVLITLAIVAIMSQWALGRYQIFIAESRRHEAKLALLELASALEDYALQNHGYAHATLKKCHAKSFVAANNYQLLIQTATQQRFLIAAKPLGKQARLDARCGILSLSSSGKKAASGPASFACW